MTSETLTIHRLSAVAAWLVAAVLAGCGGGQDPATPREIAQVATASKVSRLSAPGLAATLAGPLPGVSGPIDFGVQPAAASSRAAAINDRGQAVGAVDGRLPFIWDETAGVRPIDGLPGCGADTASVELNDINGRAHVVGTVRCIRIGGGDNITTISIRAFIWSHAEGARELPEPEGQAFTQAAAINEQGAVVGQAAANASAAPVAVLWLPDGSVRSLGSLAGGRTAATDINDAGQVVGTSGNHAFLWTAGDGMRDLGTLGGPTSEASRINNRGQVVGTSTTGTAPVVVAGFLWTPEQGMRSLGTLGGSASFANAINDDGLIAGRSSNADGQTHAVLWRPSGEIQDIGGNVADALGLNNIGGIVGTSFVDQPNGLRVSRAVRWEVQPDAGVAFSLWRDSVRPALEVAPDSDPVELGFRFKSMTDGSVRGIRFFRSSPSPLAHVVNLWSDVGERLATATAPAGSSGWVRADFAAPVALQADRTYIASYFAPAGGYPADHDFFVGGGARVGPLRALADEEGGNGVYSYGPSSSFPGQSFRASNYWVDVVFEPGSPSPTGDNVSFWNDMATPGQQVVADLNPVELGMRFRSRDAGAISGIRFYRGATCALPYTVNLWTGEGQLLYAAEVAAGTGWVVVQFIAPVAIEANKDYVASYFAPEGQYAADNDYFVGAGVRSGPLEALGDASGPGSGLYVYGPRSGFPTQTYRATNYWVDVIFEQR